MKIFNEFKSYLEAQVANGSIYLWGGQGEGTEKLTDEYIRKKETSAKNAKRVINLRNKRIKAGFKNYSAYDCSGLIVYFMLKNKLFKSDKTAHGIYHDYCTPISKSELQTGDFVFKKDIKGKIVHVGVIIDANKTCVEAKGRDYGVIKKKLSGTWNVYGRPTVYRLTFDDCCLYNLKKGMKSENVKWLQKKLNSKIKSKLVVDGIFGSKTREAVIKLQQRADITADGVFGENSYKALMK